MNDHEQKSKRWMAVSVDMLDHPVVGAHRPAPKPADPNRHAIQPFVAWQMLIAEAAWKEHKSVVGNTPVTIKRGQTIIGRDHLAEKWNWTPKTVRGFLDLLVAEGMIEKGPSKGRLANIATICNYEKYQSPDERKGPVEGTLGAGSGPVQGHTLTKDTNNTFVSETRERAIEPQPIQASVETPREGETSVGHGVFVNCETIRHRDFVISLSGLQMNTLAAGKSLDDLRSLATGHALQWAAEIEAGRHPREVLPAKIANFLAASVMGAHNASISRRASPSQPPKKSLLPSELMALKRAREAVAANG